VEEYHDGPLERAAERRIDSALPVVALWDRHGRDFVLNDNVEVPGLVTSTFGPVGLGDDGVMLAVRVPLDQVLAVGKRRGILVQAATFGTDTVAQWSEVPVFPSAMITSGRITGTGAADIDVDEPLVRRAPFVDQDLDATPMPVTHPRLLGLHVEHWLSATG